MRGKHRHRSDLRRARGDAELSAEIAAHQAELRQRLIAAQETESRATARILLAMPVLDDLAALDAIAATAERECSAVRFEVGKLRSSLRLVAKSLIPEIANNAENPNVPAEMFTEMVNIVRQLNRFRVVGLPGRMDESDRNIAFRKRTDLMSGKDEPSMGPLFPDELLTQVQRLQGWHDQ